MQIDRTRLLEVIVKMEDMGAKLVADAQELRTALAQLGEPTLPFPAPEKRSEKPGDSGQYWVTTEIMRAPAYYRLIDGKLDITTDKYKAMVFVHYDIALAACMQAEASTLHVVWKVQEVDADVRAYHEANQSGVEQGPFVICGKLPGKKGVKYLARTRPGIDGVLEVDDLMSATRFLTRKNAEGASRVMEGRARVWYVVTLEQAESGVLP